MVETQAADLLRVLKKGTVSTNVSLRRIHNFAVDMAWLPAAILPKKKWPKIVFPEKRAIRMDWLPRTQSSAQDIVPKALLSIILGTEPHDKSRLPRRASLKRKDAFLHYVRSAVNSIIDAAKRSRELLFIHETIHREKDSESQERRIVLTALPSLDGDPVMVDLKAELFARLRQLAPARLLPTIAEWEKTFDWASQVPIPGTRRHQAEVRKLAMRVLRKIADDLGR